MSHDLDWRAELDGFDWCNFTPTTRPKDMRKRADKQ
jgi:hypothetical protein